MTNLHALIDAVNLTEMGKKQHQKDKMYLTASEWKTDFGGHKEDVKVRAARLPFDHCALGLTPFTHPVMAPDGTVFDLLFALISFSSEYFRNIVPYINEHGTHPISGEPLQVKDLVKLNWSKSSQGALALVLFS